MIRTQVPTRVLLDFKVYGNQNSSAKPSHIEKNLDGLDIDEKDRTLKPLAIELSKSRPQGNQVYTPAEYVVEGSIWHSAKAYAVVNDSGSIGS
ncbi:hypothetical protein L1987_54807 [Smallanthus sonchifolius]|uniref:Uncharacterized protein n=1 Tax=Smallanthus sonchifolius TaxID=185202 RepID=A0ACB9E801_9ASTR|nr:hypothetical protein L1987_54807 [Smallanthus sonchifolius]